MQCRGIRGATTVDGNSAAEIVAATRALLVRLCERNDVSPEHIVSVFFTVTDDLDAAYPARAARELGWGDTALLCAREVAVPDGIPRCIRVLMHVNTERSQHEMRHVYLRAAQQLRPDRAESHAPNTSRSTPTFGRLAVLGLGLIGASVGLGLRAGAAVGEIRGYDLDPQVTERALARGAITVACETLERAVHDAEVVVCAIPPLAMRDLLPRVSAAAPENALITDVSSAKRLTAEWARASLAKPERFVGGHPMAGSERSGVEAASADLLDGCVWLLTPDAGTDPQMLLRATELVTALGARPTQIDAAQHDTAMSLVSHLPLVAASALTLSVARQEGWTKASAFAAGGFRDTTRVASGDARMARDICLTNRDNLLAQIDRFVATLTELRSQIADGDEQIEAAFVEAKRARDTWMNQFPRRPRCEAASNG